jgi:GntR family transcriptional regulator of arabinose operon
LIKALSNSKIELLIVRTIEGRIRKFMESSGLTKYSMIEQHFIKKIYSGAIKYMEQIPTENEIAQTFNVSRHTVRKALDNLENGGFIKREQGKGTFCCYSIEKKASRNIAIITTYISDYIFPRIISGVEDVLSSSGDTLSLFNTNNDKNKEAECLKKIIYGNFDGLIIEPTLSALENVNINYFRELEKKDIPYVMFHAKYNELDCSYLGMDDLDGGYIATKYLLQLGHRKICGIFKSDDVQGVNRRLGYIKALNEFNIDINHDLIGNYTTKELNSYAYEFGSNVLSRNEKPTAFFCYNDEIAFQVLQAVRDCNLRVPEDISVIGYDDSSLATATEIKLTTIKHPKIDMGRKAVRMLLDVIERKVQKNNYIYKPELIVRDSCRSI